MGRIRSLVAVACAGVLLTAAGAAAQATTSDRTTNVTFSAPVSIPGAKRGTTVEFAADEFIRADTTLEILGKLKPAFRTDGKPLPTSVRYGVLHADHHGGG